MGELDTFTLKQSEVTVRLSAGGDFVEIAANKVNSVILDFDDLPGLRDFIDRVLEARRV